MANGLMVYYEDDTCYVRPWEDLAELPTHKRAVMLSILHMSPPSDPTTKRVNLSAHDFYYATGNETGLYVGWRKDPGGGQGPLQEELVFDINGDQQMRRPVPRTLQDIRIGHAEVHFLAYPWSEPDHDAKEQAAANCDPTTCSGG